MPRLLVPCNRTAVGGSNSPRWLVASCRAPAAEEHCIVGLPRLSVPYKSIAVGDSDTSRRFVAGCFFWRRCQECNRGTGHARRTPSRCQARRLALLLGARQRYWLRPVDRERGMREQGPVTLSAVSTDHCRRHPTRFECRTPAYCRLNPLAPLLGCGGGINCAPRATRTAFVSWSLLRSWPCAASDSLWCVLHPALPGAVCQVPTS